MTDEATPPEQAEPRVPRAERRVKAAADVLRTLIRDLYLERFGAIPPEGADLGLVLRLRVQPHNAWALAFDPPVAEQLFEQAQESQADWEVYRRGRVYCYRCATSDCEHAVPATPLEVFAGYDSTGRPEWCDLAQAFIEAKDPRVDRLFGDRNEALGLVQLGSELKGRQLAVFGKSSKTYAVLGQVVAGYFRRDGERVAITFQAVEARGGDGRIRLHLNAVAQVPGGTPLADALASGWEPGVHRAWSVASRAIETLERHARESREEGGAALARDHMKRVPSILRRLAESVERGGRQLARRTHHAEDRRREQRPVHKALDDALGAKPDSVYYDERHGTIVACGDQGRAHAFNAEGRHVTSFFIQPDAVEYRLRTRRWRRAADDELEKLKASLKATP